jgi:uncharacterized protein (TIGR03086 family)
MQMPTTDLVALLALDRRAVQASVAAAADLSDAELDEPTPCRGWTLADLMAHMTVQQRGFAAAARGYGGDLDRWMLRRYASDGPGTSRAYATASADLLSAFADPQLGSTDFLLPEIRDGRPFPAHVALGFHLVDNVVHAWDVAASRARQVEFDADLLAAALEIAEQVPDGPERDKSAAAFSHRRPLTAGASPLERILLLLGRSPTWPT